MIICELVEDILSIWWLILHNCLIMASEGQLRNIRMENSNTLISILSESVCADQHRLRRLSILGRIVVYKVFVEFIFTRHILNLIFQILLESIVFWLWNLFFAIEIILSLRLISMMLDR